MGPTHDCTHPYFSEAGAALFLLTISIIVGGGLLVIGALIWIFVRWPAAGGTFMLVGVLLPVLAICLAQVDGPSMQESFGADDWARLQRELQSREADVDRYAREHPGLTTPQIVKGFLATYERPNGFQFTDPSIPPLHFKVSDWRDTVPRVVVDFGCSNHVLFDSTTMSVQQID